MIQVYHGSDHVIKQPQYLGGKADNDYGNGFYITEYEDRARSWAVLNGNQENSIVNIYELNLDGLKVLDLNACGMLAWIAEVTANRGTNQEAAYFVAERLVEQYRVDTAEYDVIQGYHADDSYTQIIEAFLLNQINVFEVERLFYKGSLGNQIFLKSQKAFENIKWIDSYEAQPSAEDRKSDLTARQEVNRFLTQRMKAILLDGYEVTGITARYAIQNQLTYRKENGIYEQTGL